MSTMKDKPAGTPADTKIIVIANPTTGAMEQITLAALKSYISAAQLSTPTGFTATGASSTSIALSWSAVSNATSYTLDRSPDGSTSWTNQYTGSGLTFTNTGLTTGTTYYYRVKATASGYTDSAYANANSAPQSYDSSAITYFTAYEGSGGSYSSTQKAAISSFFSGLKTDSIYTKIRAMYLFAGGSAINNKWNLVNPLDTNAGFRLSFVGTFTHASDGVTAASTSGTYADPFINPNTLGWSLNDFAMGGYAKTNITDNTVARTMMGLASSTKEEGIYPNYVGNRWYYIDAAAGNPVSITSVSASSGFLVASRTTSTSLKGYRNGSPEGGTQTTAAVGTSVNATFSLFNRNRPDANGRLYDPTDQKMQFFFFSQGLNDTDVSNFYTRLTTLFTALGI
jgi:Fibronectin type III domain